MKTCSRCGVEQPIENFRTYYNTGRTGHYKYCKDCEKIESRRKYLLKRGKACSIEQQDELALINKLYDKRLTLGLDVPCRSHKTPQSSVLAMVEEQLSEDV